MNLKSILAALAGMITVVFIAVSVQAAPSPAKSDLGAAIENHITNVAQEVCETVSPTESVCKMLDEDDEDEEDGIDLMSLVGGDDDE